jgi:hypothetical protein
VTETDRINISFTFTSPSGASATTGTATFTAKYNGAQLACTVGDVRSPPFGQTDCISWGTSPIAADFTDGSVMDIELNNANDWNITPTIAFSLIDGPSVPEPASLGLLGLSAMGTFAFARRRRV